MKIIDKLRFWYNYNVFFWEIVKERKRKLGAFDIDIEYYDVYYIDHIFKNKRVFLDYYRIEKLKKLTQEEVYLANKLWSKLKMT